MKINRVFKAEDLAFLENLGIDRETLHFQLDCFEKGLPHIDIVRPATLGDGVKKLSKKEENHYTSVFERSNASRMKFVPASGEASRMFQNFFDLRAHRRFDNLTEKESLFFSRLKQLAFGERLLRQARLEYPDFEEMNFLQTQLAIVNTMLDKDKLNFAGVPKALFPFHKYEGREVSAMEDHIYEGTFYASLRGEARFLFTISKQHLHTFSGYWARIKEAVQEQTGCSCKVDFSFQSPATDAVAIDSLGNLVRTADGHILLRPSGHGALLENLSEVSADLIFIKNIDNVAERSRMEPSIRYKKILGGLLLDLRKEIIRLIRLLERESVSDQTLSDIRFFLESRLNICLPDGFDHFATDAKKAFFKSKLDRPLRVCGMIRDKGNPGGGPFWVRNPSADISLQILEKHQLEHQKFSSISDNDKPLYFNPVDMVCCFKNAVGIPYDLSQYSDRRNYFLSEKNYNLSRINTLERPGLWNGGMANWNTVFIQIPQKTFASVKNVTDLTGALHRPKG